MSLLLNMSQNTYEYTVLRKKSRDNGLPLLLLKLCFMWSSCDVGHKVLMRGGKDVWKLSHKQYLEKDWFLKAAFMFLWLHPYMENLGDIPKRKTYTTCPFYSTHRADPLSGNTFLWFNGNSSLPVTRFRWNGKEQYHLNWWQQRFLPTSTIL